MLRSSVWQLPRSEFSTFPYHRVYPVECRMIQQIKVAPGDNAGALVASLTALKQANPSDISPRYH